MLHLSGLLLTYTAEAEAARAKTLPLNASTAKYDERHIIIRW